jgi:hypothetical protein
LSPPPPPLPTLLQVCIQSHGHCQAQEGGAAALDAFERYFTTAGQVIRFDENTPPPLVSLREGRMREILGLHSKVKSFMFVDLFTNFCILLRDHSVSLNNCSEKRKPLHSTAKY